MDENTSTTEDTSNSIELSDVLRGFQGVLPPPTIAGPAAPYTGSNKFLSGDRVHNVCNSTRPIGDLLTLDPQAPSIFGSGTSWGDFKIRYGKYEHSTKPESYKELEPLMSINTYYGDMAKHLVSLNEESYAFDHTKDDTTSKLILANIAAFHRGDQYRYRRKDKLSQLMSNSWWFAEAYCEQMLAKRFNLRWSINTGLKEHGIRVVPVQDPKFDLAQPLVAPEPKHSNPDDYNITVFMGYSVGVEPQGFLLGSKSVYHGDMWSFAPSFSFIIGWTLDVMVGLMYPLPGCMNIGWSRFKPSTGRGLCAGDLLSPAWLHTYTEALVDAPAYSEVIPPAQAAALPWPNDQCLIPHSFDNTSGLGSLNMRGANKKLHHEKTEGKRTLGDDVDDWLKLWGNYKPRIRKAMQTYSPYEQCNTQTAGALRRDRLNHRKFKYMVK